MISKIYISRSDKDEALASELASALWRVGLESYSAVNRRGEAISRQERAAYGIRSSDCLVAILTADGALSRTVNQEIGFARGIDHLVIPLLEEGLELPFIIAHLKPIPFRSGTYLECIALLLRSLRELGRLEWLKVVCPHCGEEMTQYMTSQEEVDMALMSSSPLETACSYCEHEISLDPRTFKPIK